MAKKKSSSNNYFTQETEDAIVRYNNSTDPIEKNRIFSQSIYHPVYKLSENLIHTFKFYHTDVNDIEDLKLEVVTMVVEEKLHRFDPTLGFKAYSYFGTIIKRWLINYNRRNYKKKKQEGSFEELEYTTMEEVEHGTQPTITLSEIVNIFVEKSYETLERDFPKKQEQVVADAVLTLFKTRHDLDIFKKKALYIYIREMTDCETPTLTKVINKLKDNFYEIYKLYQKHDYFIQ